MLNGVLMTKTNTIKQQKHLKTTTCDQDQYSINFVPLGYRDVVSEAREAAASSEERRKRIFESLGTKGQRHPNLSYCQCANGPIRSTLLVCVQLLELNTSIKLIK